MKNWKKTMSDNPIAVAAVVAGAVAVIVTCGAILGKMCRKKRLKHAVAEAEEDIKAEIAAEAEEAEVAEDAE